MFPPQTSTASRRMISAGRKQGRRRSAVWVNEIESKVRAAGISPQPFFVHEQNWKLTEAELVSCGITDFAVYYRQILVTGEGRDHICLTISLR